MNLKRSAIVGLIVSFLINAGQSIAQTLQSVTPPCVSVVVWNGPQTVHGGTGFVIRSRSGKPYFITAAHVPAESMFANFETWPSSMMIWYPDRAPIKIQLFGLLHEPMFRFRIYKPASFMLDAIAFSISYDQLNLIGSHIFDCNSDISTALIGSTTTAYGYPAKDDEPKYGKLKISSGNLVRVSSIDQYVVSGDLVKGMSGGPVLDNANHLLGVVSGNDPDLNPDHFLIIKSDSVCSLID